VVANVSGTASGGTLYVIITSSAPEVATVADVVIGTNGGSANIVPGSPANLSVGDHTATITVRACVNDATCNTNQLTGSPKTITVNYALRGMKGDAALLEYFIGNTAVPADYTRSFIVNHSPANGWAATTDIPFLAVTPATEGANLATTVTASIDPALLDQYEGGDWTGNIHFQPNSVFSGMDVPITIRIRRTRVNHVSPYVAESGTSKEVVIRGEYFDEATPTAVKFGAVDATSFTVVSPTEIRATHPALAAGRYPVHVNNAQGIDRTTAELVVVDPVAFPAEGIDYPDGPGALLQGMAYDAERSALLVHYLYGDTSTVRLARFVHGTSGWQFTGSTPVPYFAAFALSADGRKIILARGGIDSRSGAIEELDPVTLAVTRTYEYPALNGARSVIVANDGNILVPTFNPMGTNALGQLVLSPLRHSIRLLDPPAPNFFGLESGEGVGSGDGSRVLLTDGYYDRTFRYVRGVQVEQVVAGRPLQSGASANRRGTLFATHNPVTALDGSLALIGNAPNSVRAPAIAPEAARLYAYDDNGTVRVFDTSASVVNGELAEVTPAITPAADPGGPDDIVYLMRISPDGRALFIGGRERLVVQPLP
jgi:hypothetical protein